MTVRLSKLKTKKMKTKKERQTYKVMQKYIGNVNGNFAIV